MATAETPQEQKVLVKEMSWDPITRIVGSLGIHTEIDFSNQQVLKCYSTSMVFRGFDICMRGIDPRDAHFITSRICGICGDNHCTCSCLNQNMAYGVKPPPLGDLAFNLAETADYMFDHAIFNDCMANVDFCEQMVKETNPTLLTKAESTSAPHADLYDFFLQELPGYDMVGYRDSNLINWGSFDDPDYVDYSYANMTEWGRKRYVTPGIAINGELITTDLVEINLAIRILLGSSYFDSWENEPTFVTRDPLGNPV